MNNITVGREVAKHQGIAKHKMAILLIFFIGALPAIAQTNTNSAAPPVPTDPTTFIGQVVSWGTSFNTNETWANTQLSLWTAANFQSGAQASAEIGASYDLWTISQNVANATRIVFAPEGTIRNASIGGVVVSTMAGFNLAYEHYDFKLEGYVEGGYNEQFSTGELEIGARAVKKMTTSTFVFVGIYWDVPFKGTLTKTPSATTGVGWTF